MPDAGPILQQEQQAQREAAQQDQRDRAAAQKAWDKAMAANAGGRYGKDGFTTNFENCDSLDQMRAMVMSAKPHRMHEVADAWDQVHQGLTETAQELGVHVNNLLAHWQGQSADAFRSSAQQLHESLTNGATYAKNTGTAMRNAGDALAYCQQNMPHDPSNWNRFTRAMTSETNDYQFREDAAKYGLAKALQLDGSQLTARGEAYQQGVVQMEKLAATYNAQSAALSNGPGRKAKTDGVWPASVDVHPRTVPEPSGSTPAAPNQESTFVGGSGSGTHYKGFGGVGAPPSPTTGAGEGTGIVGGVPTTRPAGALPVSATSLDGISGGIAQAGGGLAGVGGVDPVSGVPGGLGRGLVGAGVGGALGIGGLGSAAFRDTGANGEALEGEGERLGSGALGEEGGEFAAHGGSVEGESGTEGMMGGAGGLGHGSKRKKKRKERPSYLVEDEETWALPDTPNPPVIG